MTPLGILAYLGLAVVSLDPFGGIVAAAALARGATRRALATLVIVYVAAITVAILVLNPLLGFLGRLLSGLLAQHLTWSVSQLVIAAALLVVAGVQLRASLRPPKERTTPVRTGPLALAGAALLLAVTSMPDPPFIAAVGIAGHVHPRGLGIAMLVGWNLIYQSPMFILAGAGLLGAGPRAAALWERLVSTRRVLLQRTLAVLLTLAGIAGIIDAVHAMVADSFCALHLLVSD